MLLILHIVLFLPAAITFLVTDPVFNSLYNMSSEADTHNQDATGEIQPPTGSPSGSCDAQPTQVAQPTVRMTDLLLQGSAAKSAQKHGGTGVDEFMQEIPIQKKRARSARRRLCELPPKFKQTMGRANILWARGEIEDAKAICMELIRQGKTLTYWLPVSTSKVHWLLFTLILLPIDELWEGV